MHAIEAEKLTKVFPGKRALVEVSFAVPQGAVCGFLGPNGAGKTTAVRLLNGVLAPTSGRAILLGHEAGSHPVETHRLCGVLTETAASYENLDAVENLRFFGRLHSMRGEALDGRIDELLKTLDLHDARNRKVKTFSTGMKKRMSLARALLHHPKVLFLDEPTSGLDPESARNVTLLIQRLADEERATVFLCTHQLRYAEEICTLYGLIDDGRMLGFGSFDELAAKKGHREMLELRGRDLPVSVVGEPVSEGAWSLAIDSPDDISPLLQRVLAGGGVVHEVHRKRWSLEDLYFAYQRGDHAH